VPFFFGSSRLLRENSMMRRLPVLLRAWLPGFFPMLLVALPFYVIRFHVGPIPTTFLECVILLFLFLFSLAHGRTGWKTGWDEQKTLRWPIVVWLFVSLAAAGWSLHPWTGLGLWRAYVLEPILIFFILPTLLQKKKDCARMQTVLALLPVFLLLWAAVQFVTGMGIPSPWHVSLAEGRRATGPFPFPNALALFVVPIGAWAGYTFFRKPKRWWFALSWVAVFLVALLARSDGGTLALLVATWVAMLFFKRWRIIAFVLAGTIAGAAVTFPSIHDPLLHELLFQGWSGKVRLIMWGETWNMLRDHVFFGAGFGGYPALFVTYHKATFIEIFQYPHNILFNFWSETGLPGVLSFGWLWITWFRTAWKHSRSSFFLVLVVSIAYFVHGLVDVPFFKNDLAVIFWILLYFTTRSSLTEVPTSDRIPQQ